MSSYQQSSQLIPVSTLFVQGSTQRPGVPWHCLKPNIRTMERIHCEHCGDNYRQRGFENVSDQQTHLSNWQSESLLQDSPPKLDDDPPKLEDPKPEPPKPEELCPRDPDEKPPPPRPPANGLPLLSGEHPSTKGSPVCPGGQEHSTCPRPLFWSQWHWWNYSLEEWYTSHIAPGPHGLGEQGEFDPNWEKKCELQWPPRTSKPNLWWEERAWEGWGKCEQGQATHPTELLRCHWPANQLYVPTLSQPPTILGKLSSRWLQRPREEKGKYRDEPKDMWFCIHQSRYAWRLRMY